MGNHDAINGSELFDAVQAKLTANKHQHSQRRTKAASSPLHRKLFDAQGVPMQPSFGYGRGKKIYRYYVSQSLLPQDISPMSSKRLLETASRTPERTDAVETGNSG